MTLNTQWKQRLTTLAGTVMRRTLLGAGVLMLLVPAADARVIVRTGFGYYPGFYGWNYWGGSVYPRYRVLAAPRLGDIKFDTKVKNSEVYINGAFAGTVARLKTLHLRPGSYDLQLRSPSGNEYNQRVYVLAGKTLHIKPDLS